MLVTCHIVRYKKRSVKLSCGSNVSHAAPSSFRHLHTSATHSAIRFTLLSIHQPFILNCSCRSQLSFALHILSYHSSLQVSRTADSNVIASDIQCSCRPVLFRPHTDVRDHASQSQTFLVNAKYDPLPTDSFPIRTLIRCQRGPSVCAFMESSTQC